MRRKPSATRRQHDWTKVRNLLEAAFVKPTEKSPEELREIARKYFRRQRAFARLQALNDRQRSQS